MANSWDDSRHATLSFGPPGWIAPHGLPRPADAYGWPPLARSSRSLRSRQRPRKPIVQIALARLRQQFGAPGRWIAGHLKMAARMPSASASPAEGERYPVPACPPWDPRRTCASHCPSEPPSPDISYLEKLFIRETSVFPDAASGKSDFIAARPDEVGPTGRRLHTSECEIFGLALCLGGLLCRLQAVVFDSARFSFLNVLSADGHVHNLAGRGDGGQLNQ